MRPRRQSSRVRTGPIARLGADAPPNHPSVGQAEIDRLLPTETHADRRAAAASIFLLRRLAARYFVGKNWAVLRGDDVP